MLKHYILPVVALAMFGSQAARAATPLIAGPVDDRITVALPASRSAQAAFATDAGSLPASRNFQHVLLGLKRSPSDQAALDRLVADQQTRGSPNYHHWLRAADLRGYGPAAADIDKVTAWLQAQGFSINAVSPSGMTIDFSGSAGQIQASFHTAMHAYVLHGESHVANAADVAIPAALAPVIDGVTLSNFFPRPNMVGKPAYTVPTGAGNLPFYAVTPADFNVIYNLDPVYAGSSGLPRPLDGTGVTIAVVEQTDILPADWTRFRSFFGLGNGSLSSLHPAGCTNPGRTADEGEAALDAEWAGATAQQAYIVEASCAATETTFGVMTTLRNLVESTDTDASVYSISYGACEQEAGLAFLDMWSNLAEEGAAKGISIVVSAGDSGAGCDRGTINADGLGVNGLAANPYVTSVGGTDFLDTALGKTATYWSRANTPGRGSALSYIPEIPWNNSCAGSVVASYEGAASGLDFCNSSGAAIAQNGVGGTGGASLLYAKPSWQSAALPGMPHDGVRDQPDVSFFAANGFWDHAYLICLSDASEGGSPCRYSGANPSTGRPYVDAQLVGGTSVAAPAFAGILALETELAQARLGNPNTRLYELASLQFTNAVLRHSCNATLGRSVSKACVFNNVTDGDIAQPCYPGTADCRVTNPATQGLGVLATNDGASAIPAYPAHAGYNLATGLGSLNVTNLLLNY